eukprot:583357-Rhodomonas_salina.1
MVGTAPTHGRSTVHGIGDGIVSAWEITDKRAVRQPGGDGFGTTPRPYCRTKFRRIVGTEGRSSSTRKWYLRRYRQAGGCRCVASLLTSVVRAKLGRYRDTEAPKGMRVGRCTPSPPCRLVFVASHA